MHNYKYFCPFCKTSGKGASWTCGQSDHKDDYMSCSKTRYPSKSASRSKWKEFIKHLESSWHYTNGTSSYSIEYRHKVTILRDNI